MCFCPGKKGFQVSGAKVNRSRGTDKNEIFQILQGKKKSPNQSASWI